MHQPRRRHTVWRTGRDRASGHARRPGLFQARNSRGDSRRRLAEQRAERSRSPVEMLQVQDRDQRFEALVRGRGNNAAPHPAAPVRCFVVKDANGQALAYMSGKRQAETYLVKVLCWLPRFRDSGPTRKTKSRTLRVSRTRDLSERLYPSGSPNSSGSLANTAAMRCASSRVSSSRRNGRRGSFSKYDALPANRTPGEQGGEKYAVVCNFGVASAPHLRCECSPWPRNWAIGARRLGA